MAAALAAAAVGVRPALADDADSYLKDAQSLYQGGQYFRAARYAFAASEANEAYRPVADSWVALALMRAGLYNSSAYFFIRTLQGGDRAAIRRVLGGTQELLVRVGGDLLRKYLILHTKYEDYDSVNLSAYLYSLGKDALLSGKETDAVGYLGGVSEKSPLRPFALELRGSAYAILGKNDAAIRDFRSCAASAKDSVAKSELRDSRRAAQAEREAEDLMARCQAGEARTLYQMDRFDEADQVYDRIAKKSLVWPDILFEQAWNSFGRAEYNRTLGKLVSYKSPALSFVFNSEVDVLRSQAYLALCLYADANDVINEFNGKYTKVGERVKDFVESNEGNLPAFYEKGKEALNATLYTGDEFLRMENRFVRSPYFQNLVVSEREIGPELSAIRQFSAMQGGVEKSNGGFAAFLEQVLSWRLKTIRMLGGAFVKNSLMDYHSALISDFEKMAFIKLEMLKRAKEALMFKHAPVPGGERSRGNVEPTRRDYQYYWSFNGEFWNDELGDYVFGLESECH